MRGYASDVAFTPAVKAIQEQKGSRRGYARMEQGGGWQTTLSEGLAEFLAGLDMFYLGTASADGQPYIQYRGGPPGFLKALDERTLAFADFGGNRQYITLGNLSENPKAFLFLMDYANQRRVKVWGTARVVEHDDELLARLSDPEYPGKVERAIVFTVEAWDVNCPQHIHPRYTEPQIRTVVEQLRRRIAELEQEWRLCEPDETRLCGAGTHGRGRDLTTRLPSPNFGAAAGRPGSRCGEPSAGSARTRQVSKVPSAVVVHARRSWSARAASLMTAAWKTPRALALADL